MKSICEIAKQAGGKKKNRREYEMFQQAGQGSLLSALANAKKKKTKRE